MRSDRHINGFAEDRVVAPSSVGGSANPPLELSLALHHRAYLHSPRLSAECTGAVFRRGLRCQEHQQGSNRSMSMSRFEMTCLPSSNRSLLMEACCIVMRRSCVESVEVENNL